MRSGKTFGTTFSRLRWKLTFSYTIVTVLSLLVSFAMLIVLIVWLFSSFLSSPRLLAPQLEQQEEVAALFFDHGMVDTNRLTGWLDVIYSQTFRAYHGFLIVVDVQGQIVAAKGTEHVPTTATLKQQLGSQAYDRVQQVLHDTNVSDRSTTLEVSGHTVILAPIRTSKYPTPQGVLIWSIAQNPLALTNLLYLSLSIEILVIALGFCLLFAVVGTFFGFFTARGFTRRLERLSTVVTRWSQGNFQYAIVDPSKDELGQVAQRLNQMAQQVQELFHAQQKVVVLEERNRLARELHDSVKQQVFSASMQLSTAESIIEHDAVVAQKHIQSAENLIDQVQQELATVIHNLRPLNLERQSLEQALTDSIREWEQQTGISASIQIAPLPAIPPEIETACYRMTQEALSNVARHSGARAVTIRLQSIHRLLTLTIQDNGHGFQVASRQGRGIGLQSMRERAEELHGSFEVKSDKGQGTTISVTYPLNEDED